MSDKIRTITIDTFTAFQKNEILAKWENGKANFDDWKDYGTDILLFNERLLDLGFTLVAILGYEGTGKSFGMKFLPSKTNIWFNADKKNATWKGGKQEYGTIGNPNPFMQLPKTYGDVITLIKKLKEKGKFVDNPIAFLLAHIEDYRTKEGEIRQRLKTFGKVANKMNIEDKLTMCYYTEVKKEGDQVNYFFRTQNSGFDTCRTNEGMHEDMLIPNNFEEVLKAAQEYI